MISRSGRMARKLQSLDLPTFPRGFLPLQHPVKVNAPPKGAKWLHEVKFDGYRFQAHVQRGRATLYTRNGLDWTARLPAVAAACAQLPDCVLDGELCLLKEDGYSTFSGLRSAMGRGKDGALTLMVFDLLWLGEADERPWPLERRKARLAQLLASPPGQLRLIQPIAAGEGPALLDAACALGWEGIVSKRLDSAYEAGRVRSDTWQKAKCRPSETVVIGGWKSRGGIGFAYVLAGQRDASGRLRYVGSVKGGYASEAGLLKRLRALETDSSPFEVGSPRKALDIHWVRPELKARSRSRNSPRPGCCGRRHSRG